MVLDEFHHRHGAELGADAIGAKLRAACYREIQEASVAVFGAPPVDGLGSAGGFKVMVRDTATLGLDSLQEAADGLAAAGNQQPGIVGMFSAFRAQTPQMYVDIDRERCKAMGVALNDVFLTLQLYLGGYTPTTSTSSDARGKSTCRATRSPPQSRAGATAQGA